MNNFICLNHIKIAEQTLTKKINKILSDDFYSRVAITTDVIGNIIKIIHLRMWIENNFNICAITTYKYIFWLNIMFNMNINIDNQFLNKIDECNILNEIDAVINNLSKIEIDNKLTINSIKSKIDFENISGYDVRTSFPVYIPYNFLENNKKSKKINNEFYVLTDKQINHECQLKIINDYKKGEQIFFKNANFKNFWLYLFYTLVMILGSIISTFSFVINIINANRSIAFVFSSLFATIPFAFFFSFSIIHILKLRNKNNRVFIEWIFPIEKNIRDFYKYPIDNVYSIWFSIRIIFAIILHILIFSFHQNQNIPIMAIYILLNSLLIVMYLFIGFLFKFKLKYFEIDYQIIAKLYNQYYWEFYNKKYCNNN